MNQSRWLKRTAQSLTAVLAFVVIVLASTITRVDRTPLLESGYYQQMQTALADLAFIGSQGGEWRAGWATVSASPSVPVTIVGGKRRGRYEFIHDEPQIRALVISNGSHRVAMLSYDVLFVSPYLAERIQEAVSAADLPSRHLYFTATHTHSGMGGFAHRIAGELVFGKLDEKVVQMMVGRTLEALAQADAKLAQVTLGYRRVPTTGLVMNRLVASDSVDPYLRQLILTRADGRRGTLLTYSAHPTILESSFMGLAGDYPYPLVRQLESEGYDFAMFAPSTPGSHRPIADGESPEHAIAYADRLVTALESSDESLAELSEKTVLESPSGFLVTAKLPLPLRTPHIRISKKWRLRPWVYRFLMGKQAPFFDVVRLGDLLLISSSAEISGVFTAAWEAYAHEQGLKLMITSFNGEYIGYITPDEYYDQLQNKNEIGGMNWFGPFNGAYFDRIMRGLIHKAAIFSP